MEALWWCVGAFLYASAGLGLGMHLFEGDYDGNGGPLVGCVLFWPLLLAAGVIAALIKKISP